MLGLAQVQATRVKSDRAEEPPGMGPESAKRHKSEDSGKRDDVRGVPASSLAVRHVVTPCPAPAERAYRLEIQAVIKQVVVQHRLYAGGLFGDDHHQHPGGRIQVHLALLGDVPVEDLLQPEGPVQGLARPLRLFIPVHRHGRAGRAILGFSGHVDTRDSAQAATAPAL